MRLRPSVWTLIVLWGLLLLLSTLPTVATACAIDGKASMSADGVAAVLNISQPRAHQPWAPFIFDQSFAVGKPVQIGESRADLLLSLDSATVAAPYRWTLGDRTAKDGHAVSHTYAHPGTYQIVVDGYNRSAHRWFTFDKALVHIVPPDEVASANIGFTLNQIGDAVMSRLVPVADVALIALIVFTIVRRRRHRSVPGAS